MRRETWAPIRVELTDGTRWEMPVSRFHESAQINQLVRNFGIPEAAAVHPLIRGMFDCAPEIGDAFPTDERQRWMEAMKLNLGMIYQGRSAPEDEAALGAHHDADNTVAHP